MVAPRAQDERALPDPHVRIRTLGGFSIEHGGAAAPVRAPGGGKPVALLKVLIALGGTGVHVSQLEESLWPDSDGDRAYSAFSITLRRLRAIVSAGALRLAGGRLSLDERDCWVDALAFARSLEQAERARHAGDPAQVERCLYEALDLYRGPFLAGEYEPPEILSARERLHGAFLRHVESSVNALAAAGEAERALALCRRALEIDDVAESLYRRAMTLCQELGRTSEGLAAYERCRELLRAGAGIEPAPETDALARALRETAQAPPVGAAAPPPSLPTHHAVRLPPALAVLPFAALGGDSGEVVLSRGLSEDLGAGLARLVGLRIVRLDALTTDADPCAAALQAGATHLLEGAVRQEGQRVRITASLTEAATRQQLWAERFDRELRDLFALQDEIADHIVTELDVKLMEGEQARLRRRATRSVEAWSYAKQAMAHHFNYTADELRLAEEYYLKAVAADPAYAFPVRMQVMMRCSALELGFREVTPEELDQLEALVSRSEQLDPSAAANLGARARIHCTRREWDRAIACSRRAIELEPDHADLMITCAWYLLLAGLPEEAAAAGRLAVRYGAGKAHFYGRFLGRIHYVLEQYEMALERFAVFAQPPRPSLGAEPIAIFAIGALVALGRMEEARRLTGIYRRGYDPDGAHCRRTLDALPFRDRSVIERLRSQLAQVGLT